MHFWGAFEEKKKKKDENGEFEKKNDENEQWRAQQQRTEEKISVGESNGQFDMMWTTQGGGSDVLLIITKIPP